MSRGFTLIEVLIAVVVAGIAVSIACTALVTTLKAEQTATRLRDADLLIRDAAAAARLGMDPPDTPAGSMGPWKLSREEVAGMAGTNAVTWQVWTLSPADHPSLEVVFATRP
jgi:prepilin-type N-terminal cleavage/methylation domain-containing protein